MDSKYLTTEAYIYAYLQEEMTVNEKDNFLKEIKADKDLYQAYVETRVTYYLLLLRKEEVGILSDKELNILTKEKKAFKKELAINPLLQEEYHLQMHYSKALQAEKSQVFYAENLLYAKEAIASIAPNEIEAAMKPSLLNTLFSYRYAVLLLLIALIFIVSNINFNSTATEKQTTDTSSHEATTMPHLPKIDSQIATTEQLSPSEQAKMATKAKKDSLETFQKHAKEQLLAFEKAKMAAKVKQDSLDAFQNEAKKQVSPSEENRPPTQVAEPFPADYMDRLEGKNADKTAIKYDKIILLIENICNTQAEKERYEKLLHPPAISGNPVKSYKTCLERENPFRLSLKTWHNKSMKEKETLKAETDAYLIKEISSLEKELRGEKAALASVKDEYKRNNK